jgi:hypothetical protein
MIANLRETTERNAEQDWLKTNLAKVSSLMQGQRDLGAVSRLIMSELTPLVAAQHGAFFLAEGDGTADGGRIDHPEADRELRLHGAQARVEPLRARPGAGRQAALEAKPILITEAPQDYIRISSGLGEARRSTSSSCRAVRGRGPGGHRAGLVPAVHETNRTFLEQLMETVGVTLNTIIATMRTEELLGQSQTLTQELQSQSEELQRQQASCGARTASSRRRPGR